MYAVVHSSQYLIQSPDLGQDVQPHIELADVALVDQVLGDAVEEFQIEVLGLEERVEEPYLLARYDAHPEAVLLEDDGLAPLSEQVVQVLLGERVVLGDGLGEFDALVEGCWWLSALLKHCFLLSVSLKRTSSSSRNSCM